MSRRVGLVVGALALLVVAVAVVAAVAAGSAVGRFLDDDAWLDRGGTVPTPTAQQVDAALRFAALAPLPPGAAAGPLHTEQGIDGLVVLRVRMAPDQVVPWFAASTMPALQPSSSPVPASLGPDLPAGTAVVPQHRAGRPGGGIVTRSAVVVSADVVEVRAFET